MPHTDGFLKRYPFIAGMVVIAGIVTSVGTAATVIEQLRWWTYRSETGIVARVAYKARLQQIADELIIIEGRLQALRQDTTSSDQRRMIEYWERRKRELQENMRQLLKEREQFTRQ